MQDIYILKYYDDWDENSTIIEFIGFSEQSCKDYLLLQVNGKLLPTDKTYMDLDRLLESDNYYIASYSEVDIEGKRPYIYDLDN